MAKVETQFVSFRSGLTHPKLSWVMSVLTGYGVKHRIIKSMKGVMLQVEKGTVEIASEILNQELATVTLTDPNGTMPSMDVIVTIDDLRDNHPFFELQVSENLELKDIVNHSITIDEDEDAIVVPKITPASEAAKVVEKSEDPADDDWGAAFFDDDDDDDDDEDEVVPAENESPIIDVDFKVVNESAPKSSADVPVPDDEEAADPEFEDAIEEGDLSAPVDGTEFLKADEVLAFEMVEFPKTKSPIKMYDIESTNVSAIGAKVIPKTQSVTYYIRYKQGGRYYRYNPVSIADWNTSLNLAIRRHSGIKEASVGSFIYNAITAKADAGDSIRCQRLSLDGNEWVIVPPKSERTAQIKKRGK